MKSKEFLIICLLVILMILIFMTWLNYDSIQSFREIIKTMQETDDIILQWMEIKDTVLFL